MARAAAVYNTEFTNSGRERPFDYAIVSWVPQLFAGVCGLHAAFARNRAFSGLASVFLLLGATMSAFALCLTASVTTTTAASTWLLPPMLATLVNVVVVFVVSWSAVHDTDELPAPGELLRCDLRLVHFAASLVWFFSGTGFWCNAIYNTETLVRAACAACAAGLCARASRSLATYTAQLASGWDRGTVAWIPAMFAGLSGVYHALERRHAFGTAHVLWLLVAICAIIGLYLRTFFNASNTSAREKLTSLLTLIGWLLAFVLALCASVALQLRNGKLVGHRRRA